MKFVWDEEAHESYEKIIIYIDDFGFWCHGKRISNEEIVMKFVWDEEAHESYEKIIIYL
jgi:rhamnose utilization protein RhaD (predicted bifunctional aldolase and dehydrogenase)